jgi:hypothetical protein
MRHWRSITTHGFREVEALRQDIHSDHGNSLPPIDVIGILRDIRDGEDE